MNQPPGYGPPPGYPAGPGYLPPPPPLLSPAGVPLADFAQRLLAYMIDVALLLVVSLVLFLPALLVFLNQLDAPDPTSYAPEAGFGEVFNDFFLPVLLFELGFLVVSLLLYYLYVVEYMHRTGQTLGKKAMKIRVVPLDPNRTLTRGIAAKRYFIEYIAGMFVPAFSWIDGLWQLWDKPYQQTLHDKFAQTVVVKVSP